MRLLKSLFITSFMACQTTAINAQQILLLPLQDQESDIPVAVQILHWHMLDNNISALAFREMDQLFTTRTVSRSGPVWEPPH